MSVEQEVQEESKAPSREEMIKFYNDQIELKELGLFFLMKKPFQTKKLLKDHYLLIIL